MPYILVPTVSMEEEVVIARSNAIRVIVTMYPKVIAKGVGLDVADVFITNQVV